MSEFILQREQDGVVVLTLNVPQLRNAISLEMREALLGHLREAGNNPDIRAVVLTGARGNFCSGGQLQPTNGAVAPDAQRTKRNIAILQDIVRLLSGGPKPTIAAVEGYAYGAGMSLATACDVLVAGESARFCASFGKIGLMADAGMLWSLPQRVGPGRAREMMLTGRIVEATEAGALGLANRVVPAGSALATALEVAAGFAGVAPLAIAAMKRVMARGPNSLEDVLHAESDAQPVLALSQDYVEGRTAFKEKRAPMFRGA
ncbi:MAG: enoyl-CoA hydratase/isomerase family protein [Sphingomonas sp.]|uniref:enoyl-CoA hydratase/isomerase family protein n=1 Tax=Sphingomonas sp. TaxID=28214 RepID=UPI00260A5571|nr:enoyl-CoA hydratase-related protein [Sphingomonas sp.]MDK2768927.1 enoyl-CoA hydratase/isomerase family protein [Sphingomonas sp.]